MRDEEKTKAQLLDELKTLRQRVAQLEAAETGRKQTEKALRKSLQLLEKIFASLEEAVFVVDSTTRSIILCNPVVEHIFGYSEQELFGQHIKCLHADQTIYEHFDEDLSHALDAKEVFHAECQMRRKDGNIFISEHTATEIVDDSGHRTAVLNVVRDISERRWAEEELKKYHDHLEELVEKRTAELIKANEQLQQEITERKRVEEMLKIKDSAIASSINAIAFADLEGNLMYVNDSFLTLWGYESEQEVLGKPAVEFWKEPEKALGVIEALRDKGGWLGELVARRKDDSRATFQLSASIITDEFGQPISMMASFVDITARKRAEEQIKASLREKEVLLKEIHHRVKNNLQVIASLLYLQSKSIQDDNTRELFNDSRNRVKSMALVHETLYQSGDLSRLNFATYIQNLIAHIFRSYRGSTGGITSKVNVRDVSLSIEAAAPCGLIINELVTNALKYAFPDRTGEIRIEMRVDEKDHFALVVSDNGTGFPKDFDVQNATSLGLRLVNSLVDQLDGTLEVQKDEGTTFKIVFTEPEYTRRV